jgi:glycosidase
MKIRPHPLLFEINTLVWLNELSQSYGKALDLGSVPPEIWDGVSRTGAQAVWLMGVWERSPQCIRISGSNAGNLKDFHRALNDFQPDDNAGSPYSVKSYSVDPKLGGNAGLSSARNELKKRGIALILDFVPNHLAFDHPWIESFPDFFIQGSDEDAKNDPVTFKHLGDKVFACGKDPFYPAWEDVAQVNAFHPRLRREVISTLNLLAGMCDGVRCDMAMLLLNEVFSGTWKDLAGPVPREEYWQEVINGVRSANPDFCFIAEAYWDMEYVLQQNGFDYCYDKRLYDRLRTGDSGSIFSHLAAPLSYQKGLLRFLENHDEERAAEVFPFAKEKAAALITFTLPGARLLHEGQAEGKKVRLPVFLRRRPAEPQYPEHELFYQSLLELIQNEVIALGDWQLQKPEGWNDNQSCRNILAWRWKKDNKVILVAVNFSSSASQGLIRMEEDSFGGSDWRLVDLFTQEHFIRSGDEMSGSGLYVGLGAWGFHCFEFYKMK